MVPRKEIVLDLTELNHSELVLLANWNGLNVSRGIPREVIEDLLNSLTPNELESGFDKMRTELSNWLIKYWPRIQMQVPKKVCPHCHECREIQILDCYEANRENVGG